MLDKEELDLVWKTLDGEHGLLKHTYEVGRLNCCYTSRFPANAKSRSQYMFIGSEAKCTFWSDQTSSSENIGLNFIFINRKY